MASTMRSNDLENVSIAEATIDQLSKALSSGQITSVELVAAYLNRIAAYDRRGPRLNSTPVLNPGCFVEAGKCDKTRSSDGAKCRSPLYGIPFTVKDSFKVAGLTAAAGSPAFANLIAQNDSFAVEALRKHGAIVLGKTNMPPMAIGGCQRGLYGRAESPYNPDYLPAAWHSGSSSGSGVAVSASLCAFGLGEETVSSGRSPASNCGLVAYTPSRGLISIRGNWPLFPLRDTVVPHTRSVRDILHVLDALVTEDKTPNGDLWKSQNFVRLPDLNSIRPKSFIDLASPGGLTGRRLGIPKMYIGKDSETADPIQVRQSILELVSNARTVLAGLGATCIEVELPVVSAYEKDRPDTQNLVERGMLPPGWNEIEINDFVSASWDEFLRINGDANYPSLSNVDPWVIHADPPEAVDTRRTSVAHDGQDKILYDYIVNRVRERRMPQDPLDFDQLPEVCVGLESARRELFEQWLSDQGLDGIVFPANADVAPSNADVDEVSSEIAWRNGTVFSNMNHVMRHLGIPSVTVTMGTMEDIGMPAGLTFAGPAYSDTELLKWAFDYENASTMRIAPSSTPELSSPSTITQFYGEGVENKPCPSEIVSEPQSISIKLSGDAVLNPSGSVNLNIEVSISTLSSSSPGIENSNKPCSTPGDCGMHLALTLTVDSRYPVTFEDQIDSAPKSFKASMEIPASERRGARFQSSLVVAVVTGVPLQRADGINKRVVEGSYIEVPYRYL
ncbi:amidase signature domain-containing protein [Hypoxylon rubiginosum]|uniref:Amidase signature domain-containing protein n=1 Tax=Hypoxylon rubiginosum TaxID=110542 RepID=A0ACB9ZEC5_9PEZI|nr:amidase signature domain-containing protein [Hypoxylon rubiginosum]